MQFPNTFVLQLVMFIFCLKTLLVLAQFQPKLRDYGGYDTNRNLIIKIAPIRCLIMCRMFETFEEEEGYIVYIPPHTDCRKKQAKVQMPL